MQLTNLLVREFRKDKQWILAMLANIEKLKISIKLKEEPTKFLMTVFMRQDYIEKAVAEAAKEVFGDSVIVADVSVNKVGKVIHVTFSNNC